MKKLLAFLLPLALTLSLTACGPRDEREDENAQYSATVSYTHLTLPTTSRV
mgnify:CR=1 FL=1